MGKFPKVILKNNTFHVSKRTLKQKQVTTIGTKFTPPYSKILMADLEEECCRIYKINLSFVEGILIYSYIWNLVKINEKRVLKKINDTGLKLQ